jgi:hypothetical protein
MHTSLGATSAESFVGDCLRHLQLEASGLLDCRAALQEVRRGLIRPDGVALVDAMTRQDQILSSLADLQDARLAFRRQLSLTLRAPLQQATIALLLSRLPASDRQQTLRTERRRVRSLGREVERLSQGNAVLIAHRMELIDRLLGILASGDEQDTYESSGRQSRRPSRPLVERRC